MSRGASCWICAFPHRHVKSIKISSRLYSVEWGVPKGGLRGGLFGRLRGDHNRRGSDHEAVRH